MPSGTPTPSERLDEIERHVNCEPFVQYAKREDVAWLISEARKAQRLREYARHHPHCSFGSVGGPCSCELKGLLKDEVGK